MPSEQPLRADAERSYEALVVAARSVFAERGLHAPLDQIARRAEIGNATLYRRFPTRAALIEAVFAESMREQLDAVERGLAEPDPWEAFASYVKDICTMQIRDRGIADLMAMDVPMTPEVEVLRLAAFKGAAVLIERAQSAGALRADCTTEDLRLLVLANAGVIRGAYRARQQASKRLVHLWLDALQARAATDGPAPPTARSMLVAMRQQGRELGLQPTRSTRGDGQR